MGLEATIFDQEASPNGKVVADQPDGFYAVAINHARKSISRFPLLGQVDPAGQTLFDSSQRQSLKSEWITLESLAIGKRERDKWTVIFSALTKDETFKGIRFIGSN